jgi:hypothetical protein
MTTDKPRRILSRAFLLNFLVVLVVTCWIPLTTLRATMTNEAGEIQAETVRSIPLYESYYRFFTSFHSSYLQAILLHWGICFAISFAVWWFVMRADTKFEPQAESETTPDA